MDSSFSTLLQTSMKQPLAAIWLIAIGRWRLIECWHIWFSLWARCWCTCAMWTYMPSWEIPMIEWARRGWKERPGRESRCLVSIVDWLVGWREGRASLCMLWDEWRRMVSVSGHGKVGCISRRDTLLRLSIGQRGRCLKDSIEWKRKLYRLNRKS